MARWEYKELVCEISPAEGLRSVHHEGIWISQMGERGWELVSMVPFEKTITQNTNDRGALISETEQLNLVLMVFKRQYSRW